MKYDIKKQGLKLRVMTRSVIRRTDKNMGEETPKFKGQNKNMTQLLLIEYTSRDFIQVYLNFCLRKLLCKAWHNILSIHYARNNRRLWKKATVKIKRWANLKKIKIYKIWSIFCLKELITMKSEWVRHHGKKENNVCYYV